MDEKILVQSTQPPTTVAPDNKKKFPVKLIAVVGIILILLIIYLIIRSTEPWFDLNRHGKLTFDEDVWHIFDNPFGLDSALLEIPTEYDGEIEEVRGEFNGNFSYDGELEDLIEYHSWLFDTELNTFNFKLLPGGNNGSNHDMIYVECEDYSVYFIGADDRSEYAEYGAFDGFTFLHYYDENDSSNICEKWIREANVLLAKSSDPEKVVPFQSLSDLYYFLDTGDYRIYEDIIDGDNLIFDLPIILISN